MGRRVPGETSRLRGTVGAGALVALGAALVAGGAWLLPGGPGAAGAVPPSGPAVASPATASPVAPPAAPPAAPAAPAAGPPVRLRLPAVGIDSAVAPVRARAGELGVPDDVDVLGWWTQGVSPGSATGTVVVDGHVDSKDQGRGALYRLAETPVGARIEVDTAGGTLAYVVQARRAYDKAQLPGDVFAVDGSPRLALITCGGPFSVSTGHYRDNVVVYATPAAG